MFTMQLMRTLRAGILLAVLFGGTFTKSMAQIAEPLPPRNVKILQEYSDGQGHIVRVVQFSQGNMRVTQTIVMPKTLPPNVRVAINPDTMRKELVVVKVDKSDYQVQVYYRARMIRAYRAVFGPNPMQDKIMEGDRATPEGEFRITNKNPGSKYTKFMGISYPNDSAKVRFTRLKNMHKIPATATIGGNVGIHGIWPGGDDMIEMGIGWTDGCVAIRNKDIEELFTFCAPGTKVFIQK